MSWAGSFLETIRRKQDEAIARTPAVPALRINASAYGRPVPKVFGKTRIAGNLLWFGDFVATPHFASTSAGGSGGKGGGGGDNGSQMSVTWTYTAAGILLLCGGPIAAVTKVWNDKDVSTLAALGLTLFTGTTSQTAWSYLSTNHPGEALAYRSEAYLASAAFPLGGEAQLGNYNFEVEGLVSFSVSIRDANPKDVANRIALDCGLAVARIGDWTAFSNYCVANGIFVSPAYTDQRPASEVLAALLDIGNAEVVYSEDLVKIVPYSDTAATGNSVTYTPPAHTGLAFGDDDFLASPGEEPLAFEDEDTQDAYNVVKAQIFNRAKDYAEDVVDSQDDDHIAIYGRQTMPEAMRWPEVVDPAVGKFVLQNKMQRGLYYRRQYRFKLGPGKADLLEPMDQIFITSSRLGFANLNVQVREIAEIEDPKTDGWELLVREAPAGVAAAAAYPTETSTGYAPNFNVAPSSVNTPVVMDAPGLLTESGFELWIAVSGSGANWGGAEVWVATDPAGPYKLAGQQFGRARHGVTTATFASGSDPDTTSVCSVDLTASSGILTGGTQADADLHNTLAWCEGELFSFRDAALTATSKYDLKNYLRRGVFNTAVATHATSSRFVRLDQAVFKLPYDPSYVGKQLYLKFPSFNVYGGAKEDISGLGATTYTIGGPIGAPDAPTSFAVQQQGPSVNFSVDKVATIYLDRIEIRYADPGETDWNNGLPVVNILRGHTDTNGTVPPGTWRFMARAFDRAGNGSKTWAIFDFTVSAEGFTTITSVHSEPAWLGRFVENWLKNSEDLTATGWNLSGATSSANQKLDRSSALTLAKLQETNANSEHYVEQSAAAGTVTDGLTATGEVYALPGERSWLYLALVQRDNASVRGAFFNLATGTIGTAESGVTARISKQMPSGGYVCSVVAPAGTGGVEPRMRAQLSSDGATKSYTGTTGSGIYVGNAGMVKGAVPREHAVTGASALTTDHGNFLVSVSNALVPDETKVAADETDIELWSTFRAYPQAVCTYQNPEIDKGIDATARIWADIVSVLGPGVSSGTANPKNMIDYRLAAGAYDGFETWTIGTVNFRYAKSEIVLTTAAGIAKVTGFNTVIDKAPRTENGTYTTPGGGSVAVSYASAFHLTPSVQVTPQGSGDVSASKTSVTTTGFTGLFKSAGAAAAGTADWSATGV